MSMLLCSKRIAFGVQLHCFCVLKAVEFTSGLEQGEGVEEMKSGAAHACLV